VWTTAALQAIENRNDTISLLNADNTQVCNQNLFNQFLKIQGTYFMNGFSSCQIGDHLIHPFEAHSDCKSLMFDGKGQIYYTYHIVETPLTAKE
jgi:carotenoid cleavage dioxygenase-like enzyme